MDVAVVGKSEVLLALSGGYSNCQVLRMSMSQSSSPCIVRTSYMTPDSTAQYDTCVALCAAAGDWNRMRIQVLSRLWPDRQ